MNDAGQNEVPRLSDEARQRLKWQRQADCRAILAGLRPNENADRYRIRSCCRFRANDAEGIWLAETERGRVAAGGYQTCGSSWICPVCAGREGAKNSDFLSKLVEAHEEAGFTSLFVTYTMPSRRSDTLAEAIGWVRNARRLAGQTARARYIRKSMKVTGSVQVMEITWSPNSGWHVHLHELLLLDLTETQLFEFRDHDSSFSTSVQASAGKQLERTARKAAYDDLFHAWSAAVEKVSGRQVHAKYGVDVQVVHRGDACKVVRYQAPTGEEKEKLLLRPDARPNGVALEMALSSNKQGRVAKSGADEVRSEVFWTLLDRAGLGDDQAAFLVREYAAATFGHSCMTMRVGELVARYGIGIEDEPLDTDEGPAIDRIVHVVTLDHQSFEAFRKSDRISPIGRLLVASARAKSLHPDQQDDLSMHMALRWLGWKPTTDDWRYWSWFPHLQRSWPEFDHSLPPVLKSGGSARPDEAF